MAVFSFLGVGLKTHLQKGTIFYINFRNHFKGNVGETSERRHGAHNYGLFRAPRYHLELN